MATLGIAGFGYGIRYETACSSRVSTMAGRWNARRTGRLGNPFEFERPEAVYPVRLAVICARSVTGNGQRVTVWEGGQRVLAVAYDTMIAGYGGHHINTLRLWSAQSGNLVDLEAFNRGDYMQAMSAQVNAESISRVLYPNDATPAGQELRLKQEYFFTAASLQDITRRHLSMHGSLDNLGDHVAIQLNDTHPAIAVPELMRLLIDENGYGFDAAFAIVRSVIHYTNHTLMPEALERWPVQLLENLLPRHMQLIYEINAHILGRAAQASRQYRIRFSATSRLSRRAMAGRCAWATWPSSAHAGSMASALHTDLMKKTVFRNLHHYFPDRIVNETNGITPAPLAPRLQPAALEPGHRRHRRWLITRFEQLGRLEPHLGDRGFLDHFADAKRTTSRDSPDW
ncbi:MAG: glycogen/starch/alpha-glucan phosphorylase [Geminicoccaceae bacterium]